jgi:hypothetical protein
MVAWRFEATVWAAESAGAWHFVSVPASMSEEIRDLTDAAARPGFGSVRVAVTIGRTSWRTSVFPDTKRGTYVLPVKQAVRRAEGFGAGDVVTVALELLE